MGKPKDPQPVIVEGCDLRCTICSHDLFFERRAQLNTAAASFFNFDWANTSARCVVCANCGYIRWFLPQKRA